MGIVTYLLAQHFLIGGDWGPENQRHSHHYVVELHLEGSDLDQHGYLVDIVRLQSELADLRTAYGDTLLNDLPEFRDLNPSIEHFARILCHRLGRRIAAPNLSAIAVRLWENDSA